MTDPYAAFSKLEEDPYADFSKIVETPKSKTGIGFIDRSNDKAMAKYDAGQARARVARAEKAPIVQPERDFMAPVAPAFAQVGEDFSAMLSARGDPKADSKLRGSLFAAALSPFAGALDVVVRPMARAAERVGVGDEDTNRGIANTALMGLGPAGMRAALPVRAAAAPAAVAPKPSLAGVIDKAPPRALVGKPKPAQIETMRAEQARLSAAGVQPTFTDVAGEAGRRTIRAIGAKKPEAGEVLQGRAREVTSSTKPGAMDRTTKLVADPRTADQLIDDIFKARDEAASANYAGAYATPVPVDAETMAILSDGPGKSALQRARSAALLRQDGARVAEIDALMKGEPITVTAGTLDRARIAMRDKGTKAAAQPGGGDLASGWRMRTGQLDDTLDAVPELAPARADYRAKSQALDVLDKGRQDVFSTAPADYESWVRALSPEAHHANQMAIRQSILDALGGKKASSFGSLDQLASSQYAKQNLRAAFGPEEAEGYLAHLEARLGQTRNATFVSPNAGSRTAVLGEDMNAGDLLGKGVQLARGDVLGVAVDSARAWLKTRSIPDDVAAEIARQASDPAALEGILSGLESQIGRNATLEFMQQVADRAGQGVRRALPTIGAAGAIAPPTSEYRP